MNKNKVTWEDVKKQWTWEYLTSNDMKSFYKRIILPGLLLNFVYVLVGMIIFFVFGKLQ